MHHKRIIPAWTIGKCNNHTTPRPLTYSLQRISVAAAVGAVLASVASTSVKAATDNWRGVADSSWDTPSNWSLLAPPTLADDAIFPAIVPLTGDTITLGPAETALSLTFRNAYTLTGDELALGTDGNVTVAQTFTATINSVLQGTDGLTVAAENGLSGIDQQTGGGTLVLTHANTFSKSATPASAVTIGAGTLSVSANDNLGDPANGLAINGGTLQSTGTFSTTRTVAIGTNGSSFDVNVGNILTITGVVSGTASGDALTKTGGGTLVLDTATNTFTGNIVIKEGFISANDKVDNSNPNPPRNLGNIGNDIYFDGGGIRWNAPSTNSSVGRWTVDAGSFWNIGFGGATVDVTNLQSNKIYFRGTDTIGGVNDQIRGAGTITKIGLGPITIENSNPNFTGNWVVNNGILEPRGTAALGNGTNQVTMFDGELANSVSGGSTTIANAITMNGGALSGETGNTPVFSGPIKFNYNSFLRLGDWYQDVARNLQLTGPLSGDGAITVAMGSFGTFTNPANGVANTNTGTLFIKNSGNTITGQITINNNLKVNTASTTNVGNTLGVADVTLAGGTLLLKDNGTGSSGLLDYTGNDLTVIANAGGGATTGIATIDVNRSIANSGNTFRLGGLNLDGQQLNVTGANSYALEFTAPGSLTGNSTLNVTTANLTISGGLSGSTFDLTKEGAGTLTLASTQDYATLNANAGTTNLNAALGNGASTINANAVLNITVNQDLAVLNVNASGMVTFTEDMPPGGAGVAAIAALSLGSEGEALAVSSVPEPSSLGLLLIGALALLGRQGRETLGFFFFHDFGLGPL